MKERQLYQLRETGAAVVQLDRPAASVIHGQSRCRCRLNISGKEATIGDTGIRLSEVIGRAAEDVLQAAAECDCSLFFAPLREGLVTVFHDSKNGATAYYVGTPVHGAPDVAEKATGTRHPKGVATGLRSDVPAHGFRKN